MTRSSTSASQSFAGVRRCAFIHDGARSVGHWSEAAPDPNDPLALALRSSAIRQAWIPEIPNRLVFLLERCDGKRVLDIGCVAHDLARMDAAHWLHGQISSVASSCLGVDIHSAASPKCSAEVTQPSSTILH